MSPQPRSPPLPSALLDLDREFPSCSPDPAALRALRRATAVDLEAYPVALPFHLSLLPWFHLPLTPPTFPLAGTRRCRRRSCSRRRPGIPLPLPPPGMGFPGPDPPSPVLPAALTGRSCCCPAVDFGRRRPLHLARAPQARGERHRRLILVRRPDPPRPSHSTQRAPPSGLPQPPPPNGPRPKGEQPPDPFPCALLAQPVSAHTVFFLASANLPIIQ